MMFDFYSAYDLPPRVDDCSDFSPSLTVQADKDDCDINVILANAQRSGVVSNLAGGSPRFLDVSDVPDYASSIRAVRQAEEAFLALPATLRAELNNDPALFIDFCMNPDNTPRLEALGLKVKAPESVIPVVPSVE